VKLSAERDLRLCVSDVSPRLGPPFTRSAASHWISAAVEVFRSSDLTTPIPLEFSDLIFANGQGNCVTISGAEVSYAIGNGESIVVTLTSYFEADAKVSPIVSGQFIAEGGEQEVGLLIPAVQKAREGNPRQCCACVPVCGCGICD
jgi:hypothetical protein